MREPPAQAWSGVVRDLGHCYQLGRVISRIPPGKPDSGDREAVDKSSPSPSMSTGPDGLRAPDPCWISLALLCCPLQHKEQRNLIHKTFNTQLEFFWMGTPMIPLEISLVMLHLLCGINLGYLPIFSMMASEFYLCKWAITPDYFYHAMLIYRWCDFRLDIGSFDMIDIRVFFLKAALQLFDAVFWLF